MVVLQIKITCASFSSFCNVVVINFFMLVIEGKLACVIFSSWCDVFDGNVVVPIGNLTCVRFHVHTLLLLEMYLMALWLYR